MNSGENNQDPANVALGPSVEVSTQSIVGSGLVTHGFAPATIHRSLHPHDDAIRIRVLEKMFEELLEVLTFDKDVATFIRPIQARFHEWLTELRSSKYVDVVYSARAIEQDINGNSLPYQLKLPNLIQVKKDSKGE